MKELGVYPGSFRPFHNEHLAKVKTILSTYPDQDLILAVAGTCLPTKKYNIFSSEDALKIVSLVISSEGLENRVAAEIVKQGACMPLGVSRVFTGSDETVRILESLKRNGKWTGEVVKLDNSGIHAEEIRRLIIQNNPSWTNYVHPVAAKYIIKSLGP